MNAPHHRGHNGGGLSPSEQAKLWDHVRALEVLEEAAADIREDQNARRALAKADGFDKNVLAAILKRRKAGEGETRQADNLVRIYEEALREQGALPLEQTSQPAVPERRKIEDIAQELHGQALPDMPERPDVVKYDRARDVVVQTQKASASHLQRVLEVGYSAAAGFLAKMEEEGIVSKPDTVGVRRVLVDQDGQLSGTPKGDDLIVDNDPF